jgi:magnesium transporter
VFDLQKEAKLELEAYPLLDGLTSKISTLNFKRVCRLKRRLVALTMRVLKVMFILWLFSLLGMTIDRCHITKVNILDEMYLIEKKRWMGFSFYGDQSRVGCRPVDGTSIFYPVSPISSPAT